MKKSERHSQPPGGVDADGLLSKLMGWVEKLRQRSALLLDGPLVMGRGREQAFLVVAAILLGVIGAYGAIGFRLMIQGAHHLAFNTGEYSLDTLYALPWWKRLLIPSVGGLLVGVIVARFAPEVKGSGIPEVMESVARRGGAIRFRVVLTKAVAASLTIGSGGSAGREGPIAHIGSAIGSALGQFLNVSARRLRTFVACGAAAGIAATFNAPIAGALFAIEVVLGDMRVANMSPIVISSVIATVISRHHLGDFPAFDVPAYEFLSAKELLLYAGMGIAAGLIALLFIQMLYMVSDLFERSPIPTWLRPAVGGLGVGLIALGLPHVFGVGYETINAALWGSVGASLLGAVLVAKLIATSLTLGAGGSGGIFAPSLFLGASLGAVWGKLATELFPDWTAQPGAYALVGMGAVVSAATHAPITAILIIFELTNDYRIIPPLMLTCVIAVLLSSHFVSESIYTKKLALRGIRLSEGRDINLLRSVKVEEVMEHNPDLISADTPLAELLPILMSGERPTAVVVDPTGVHLGTVELSHIREALPLSEELAPFVVAADVAHVGGPFVVPADGLDLVMHMFGKTPHNELPVCDSNDSRKVIGTVGKQAVIDIYNRRIFQEDLIGGFGAFVNAGRQGRTVEVLRDVHLGEIEVPTSWMEKTLKDLELRTRYGVEIVLINRKENPAESEEKSGLFPSPDLKFEVGDRVLVMGKKEAIRRLRA